MKTMSASKVVILFLLLCISIIALSNLSTGLWGSKSEKVPATNALLIVPDMTVAEFGERNGIPKPVMKETLGLLSRSDLEKKLEDLGFNNQQLQKKFGKSLALKAEHESKNWLKIPVKFGLWFVFLGVVFALLLKKRLNGPTRKVLYLAAVTVFGIILGSDPSPMGTVKDAIHLYAAKGVIFPPRMIAFSIFLLIVFLANKFICGWGCQLGALQDLLFRLNRNTKDTRSVLRQYKPPFMVTNAIRTGFLVIFTAGAFLWGMDIIEPIDPFKIYKPAYVTGIGWIFIVSLLALSLFVYRPWCQLFCPFGLVGWLVEKVSLLKIKVDYESCIGCEACARACPSTVMNAILKRRRIIPDCFACGTCINVCPTDSIKFRAGKRAMPPQDKFNGDRAAENRSNQCLSVPRSGVYR